MNGQRIKYKITFNPKHSKYGTYGYIYTHQQNIFDAGHKYILKGDNFFIRKLISDRLILFINNLS